MMEVIYVAAVVLSLLSVGQSAPLNDCENLIRPLENPGTDMMLGTWVIIATSYESPGTNKLWKTIVGSGWSKSTAGSQSNTLTVIQSRKISGLCFKLQVNMTFENNTFHIIKPFPFSGVLLNTVCPDCFLGHDKTIKGGTTFGALHLLSKRRTVTAAELDEFQKQVKCLNLPSPVIMDPDNDLCPDQQSQGTDVVDLNRALDANGDMNSTKVEELINKTKGGLMVFEEKFKSALTNAMES
ncbi:uncharacterized protein ACJ7VT_018753 isoform 1-T1 [Polymixia lowei]